MNENKKLITGIVAGMAFTMAVSNFFGVLEPDNFITGLLWIIIGYHNINQYKNK